jgi:hypothetical protein
MRSGFRSNANKDFLRSRFDKLLIETWSRRVCRPLHYLGLPGPEMLDIIEWQEYLGRFTTIERKEDAQHLMFLKAHVKDVEHRLHSLYGNFDDILLTGRDSYGHTPDWPYDLINLDYFGGFLYRNLARPKALKQLIVNQCNYCRSFFLVITQDLRENDSAGEMSGFLEDLKRVLVRDFGEPARVGEFIDNYRSKPASFRQALYMNLFLRDAGEAASFRVTCRPAIAYTGTGNSRMIHFVTDFEYHRSEYRAVSEQSLLEVLNLGLLDLENERLDQLPGPRLEWNK